MENNWTRVKDLADPNRCQHIIPSQGQCLNTAVPGCQYCPPHGGSAQLRKNKAVSLRNYRLTKFRARASELGNNDQLSSLKDEVAILRLLIEEKLNHCADAQQLLLSSGPLSDLIMKCTVVVEKCHKLDSRLGNLLDRDKVTVLAQSIVEIVSEFVSEEQLDEISDKIVKTLDSL